MVSRKQAYLIVGSCLLACWYLALFGFIPSYSLFVSIPMLGSTSSPYLLFSFLTLGAGSALLIYSLTGRSRCKWVIIPLLLLGATIYFAGMRGLVELLRNMSLMAGLLLSTVYLRRVWMKAIALILIFSLMVAMGININIQYSLESNPFDVPERDRLNARYGYDFCGEYIVDPTPGLHKVVWRKTLRANDTIACYFKVKLPEASRYVLAGHRFEWRIDPSGAGFSFYHAISYCEDLFCLEHFPAWKYPFYSYSDGSTGGHAGDLDSARAFNRIDVYVSYRPSDASDRRILSRSYVEVWWRLELKIW